MEVGPRPGEPPSVAVVVEGPPKEPARAMAATAATVVAGAVAADLEVRAAAGVATPARSA
ncbi:hypothetical protein ACIQMR_06705 [Streptomyces sp. NPDC091376]|uniref:hypothetical protein n=1 Tax=Streptomyces sp. NPDC091376 TaxID=3365994 RepID=UPI0037F35748